MAKLPLFSPMSLYSSEERCPLVLLPMEETDCMGAGVPSLGSRGLACGGLLSWCGGRPRADLEVGSVWHSLCSHDTLSSLLHSAPGSWEGDCLLRETPGSSLERAFLAEAEGKEKSKSDHLTPPHSYASSPESLRHGGCMKYHSSTSLLLLRKTT